MSESHHSSTSRITMLLGIASLFVAIVSTMLTRLTVKEIREWLRLERPSSDQSFSDRRPAQAQVAPVSQVPVSCNYADINRFFDAFKQAAGTKDMRALAECVHFPFDQQMSMMTRDEFIANYQMGNDELRLLMETPLTKYPDDLGYGVNTPVFAMHFERDTDGYWKWTSTYYGE